MKTNDKKHETVDMLTRLGVGSVVSASSSLFLLIATTNAQIIELKV